MILQFLIAMLATSCFAVLFHAPAKQIFFCALSGGIGWICYLIFQNRGSGPVVASLIATFLLTIVSRLFAAIRKNPATLYLLIGIFTLVPGAGIYYTSYYMIMNDMEPFAAKGIETFKIAGAIAVGIIFASSIPQSLFEKIAQAYLKIRSSIRWGDRRHRK